MGLEPCVAYQPRHHPGAAQPVARGGRAAERADDLKQCELQVAAQPAAAAEQRHEPAR